MKSGKEILEKGPLFVESMSQRLNNHTLRNRDTSHINKKIYHLLEDPYTFINAYARISKNKGALTKGIPTDDAIMYNFSIQKATQIANMFTEENYKWSPTRRVWIEKPGKKSLRPIDTPTQKDRICQEAIRGILESIFEPEFAEFEIKNEYRCTNYGFRANKSAWDAMENIKRKAQGTTLAIEGDISNAYGNVNHSILLKILKRRIKDKKFITLIYNLLKAGIMDKDTYEHTLKGTPQGGIVSPLLFNIYMFEFDKFILENIINKYNINQPTNKTRNKEYSALSTKITKALIMWRTTHNPKDLQYFKSLKAQQLKTPAYEIQSLPKRALYCRYADDWVLFLTETHENITPIKMQISNWIKTNLTMELDPTKTLISRIDEGVRFLGFSIKMWDRRQVKLAQTVLRQKQGTYRFLKRTTSRKITIGPDQDRLWKNLIRQGFCNPSQTYSPDSKSSWTVLEEYAIVLKYSQIMRGIFNYYRECDNKGPIHYASYILQYSCAKTLAHRKRISMSKVFSLYGKELRITKQFYSTSKTTEKSIHFPTSTELFKTNTQTNTDLKPPDPFHINVFWRTKFKFYLECCICGSENDICMHHINSLKKTKPNKDKFAYIRGVIKRLQIPVCEKCHLDIHRGKYSKENQIEFDNLYLAKL